MQEQTDQQKKRLTKGLTALAPRKRISTHPPNENPNENSGKQPTCSATRLWRHRREYPCAQTLRLFEMRVRP